jgi:hypothetical protein
MTMNQKASLHLAKAAGYVAKGELFYRKAAEEIAAAKGADTSLSNREIGERIGREKEWVRRVIAWHTSGSPASSPHELLSGNETARKDASGTKKLLREAPLEQVEQIIDSLPKERRQAIAAAAGNSYAKARQEHDERERNLTDAEKRERQQAGESLVRPIRQAVAGFSMLGIIGHLQQATEELRELIADGSLTPKVARQIDRASDAWNTELRFALQMVGEEEA